MEKETDPIIAACEAEWDTWKSDCSGSAKAVARRLGITLSGHANSMIDALEGSSRWLKLGSDKAAAITRAKTGYLVIGGLKAKGHGHVLIVVGTGNAGYPVGYWGRFGAVGKNAPRLTGAGIKPIYPKYTSMRPSHEILSACLVLLCDDACTHPGFPS